MIDSTRRRPACHMQFLWRQKETPGWAASGVALHGHTHHSRENLRFLNSYRDSIPLVALLLRLAAWQHRRWTGESFRPERAFWRPPLSGREAWELESRSIGTLGLQALISITDHDEIQGCLEIPGAPVSVEWSVPFGPTLLHLGIHNLPPETAAGWHAEMLAYTARPSGRRLTELLAGLHAIEDVLIVLNHPYWDGCRVGTNTHAVALGTFLGLHRPFLHAMEVNGLRPARENEKVLALARSCGMPVVAGGDRHGFEPSSCLNLSRARTFAEFVREIRVLQESYIVFTSAYRASTRWRWLRTAHEIVCGQAASHGARTHWMDQFYYHFDDGREISLAEAWGQRNAYWLTPCLALLKLTVLPGAQSLSRWLFSDGGELLSPAPAVGYLFPSV